MDDDVVAAAAHVAQNVPPIAEAASHEHGNNLKEYSAFRVKA